MDRVTDTNRDATADADASAVHTTTPGATPAAPGLVLAALALMAALGVAVASGGLADQSSSPGRVGNPETARFELSVTPAIDRVAVVHAGGPPVAPARLRLRIAVDGEPVAHQPPVPFFAARGFRGGPVGPFNSATEGDWTAGELAALRLAGTNTEIQSGDRVVVELYRGDRPLATLEVEAC